MSVVFQSTIDEELDGECETKKCSAFFESCFWKYFMPYLFVYLLLKVSSSYWEQFGMYSVPEFLYGFMMALCEVGVTLDFQSIDGELDNK